MEGLQVVPVEILPGPEVPASGIQEAVYDRGFALERDHLVGGGVVGEGGKGHPGVVVQVVEEGLVSGGDPIPGAGVNAVTLHASSQKNSLHIFKGVESTVDGRCIMSLSGDELSTRTSHTSKR